MNLWTPFTTVTKNDVWRYPLNITVTIESRPISPSLSFSLCRAILIRKLPDRLISPNLFSLNERYGRVTRVMHGETKCLTRANDIPRKWLCRCDADLVLLFEQNERKCKSELPCLSISHTSWHLSYHFDVVKAQLFLAREYFLNKLYTDIYNLITVFI